LNIKIRKADLDDLHQLLEFEQSIITSERPFDDRLRDSKVTYYDIKQLMTNEKSHLIVAECAGELVGSGYALLMKTEPCEKYDFFSYLGFMFVLPRYRRMGINKRIMDALIDWSKNRGVVDIRLEVFDENETAVQAYEKFGFSKAIVNMRMVAS